MKTKVGIIFGGCSSEYDVSLVSVTSVIKNINKEYTISKLYANMYLMKKRYYGGEHERKNI